MKNESVAILDIRSSDVSFLLGSKGVNDTFVFKGLHTEKHGGYTAENGFSDLENFQHAVMNVIDGVRKNYEGEIRKVFVGVPSNVITIYTKGHTNSYPKRRKISAFDVEALYESGLNALMAEGKCIRRSNMYFTLGDNRKYFDANDVYGISTTMLKGGLCYYFVSEYFYETVNELLKSVGIESVYFIPSTLAQASYLFSDRQREGYAFLLDFGYSMSSISVVYGNGIVHEESIACGVEHILVKLKEKFNLDDTLAMEMLRSANVSGGFVDEQLSWTSEEQQEGFSIRLINETIKCSLDVLCEDIAKFFDKHYKEKSALGLSINPIGITGEGVGLVKGFGEHVSKQLNMLTKTVYPDLPYYDKPIFSSRISLLSMALSDQRKQNWFYKIFNNIGGKRR